MERASLPPVTPTRQRLRSRSRASLFGIVAAAVMVLGVFGAMALVQNQPEPPYPASEKIQGWELDWKTFVREAPGSDNWPVTWGHDGHQYTSFGDGGGFGGSNRTGRVSLGLARLEGDDPQKVRGVNIWGGQNAVKPASFEGKCYGIVDIAGTLYKWVSPGSNVKNYTEARLFVSRDLGESWTRADWALTSRDGLILPTIAQFGKGYEGARDDFVYSYAIELQHQAALAVQKPGKISLLRAPKDKLLDREALEFFAGLDEKGSPLWSKDLKSRKPVFEDPAGVGWNCSVSFNPRLGRYLLATEHGTTFRGSHGIFEAVEPWGPWRTVIYEDSFGKKGNVQPETFYWNFSNKWLSDDGLHFTLVFSGIRTTDAYQSVNGKFILEQTK